MPNKSKPADRSYPHSNRAGRALSSVCKWTAVKAFVSCHAHQVFPSIVQTEDESEITNQYIMFFGLRRQSDSFDRKTNGQSALVHSDVY